MDGINAQLLRLLFEKSDCLASVTATTKRLGDKQFIDESVVAVKFKTEPDGQNDVTDGLIALKKKPNAAESWKGQQLSEGFASGGFVKPDFAGFLFS